MAFNNALNETATGIQYFSGATYTGRTITGTANQISVSNGDGTSGNPTLSLTSTIQVSGISFDSGSNTLSTYTVGTFSPTIDGSSSSPTVTYTTRVGRYTKIGNRVFYTIKLQLATLSGGTGNVEVASLPYTNNNTASNIHICAPNLTSTAVTGKYMVLRATPGDAFATFVNIRSANPVLGMGFADISTSSIFTATLIVEV